MRFGSDLAANWESFFEIARSCRALLEWIPSDCLAVGLVRFNPAGFGLGLSGVESVKNYFRSSAVIGSHLWSSGGEVDGMKTENW